MLAFWLMQNEADSEVAEPGQSSAEFLVADGTPAQGDQFKGLIF